MENDVQVKPQVAKKGKWSKILSGAGIIGLFASVGLIVLAATSALHLSPGVLCVVSVVACICIGCALATPWVNHLENGRHVKLSWIFFGFVCLCTLLWVISCFVVLGLYYAAKNGGQKSVLASMLFVQIALIITFQFITSSFIASNIIKYGKKMIVFQVIAYISNLFVDVYFTLAACTIQFKPSTMKVSFVGDLAKLLVNPTMLTLICLALVYVLLSNSIIKRVNGNGEYNNTRRYNGGKTTIGSMIMDSVADTISAQNEDIDAANEQQNEQVKESNDIADKLAQLKDMYDKQLITKEEYEQKRAEILKEL